MNRTGMNTIKGRRAYTMPKLDESTMLMIKIIARESDLTFASERT